MPNFRTQSRYPLWVILLLVILGTINGAVGCRSLEAFVRHQVQLLDLPVTRLPSDTTLRRILVRVNFERLAQVFNQWVQAAFACEAGEALGVDGKTIKVNLKDYDRSYQDACERRHAVEPSTRRGGRTPIDVQQNHP